MAATHEVRRNSIPQPSLHESASKEERNHNKPNHFIREGAEGRCKGESFGDHGGREAQKGPRPHGQRAQNKARDSGEENGEELPGLGGDFDGFGNEEANNEADGYGDNERDGLCTLERWWWWWWWWWWW